MTSELEHTQDESTALPRVEEILKELEVIKRVHLQALLARNDRGAGGLSGTFDERTMKLVASYTTLVEKIVKILERREKIRDISRVSEAPVSVVMEALKDIACFRDAFAVPEIQEQIIDSISKRLAEIDQGGKG